MILISASLAGCLPTATPNSKNTGSGEFINGAVAKGFPNLPLYPGAKVEETYGKDKKYGGIFIASDDLAKVAGFYSKTLPQTGWQSSVSEGGPASYVFNITNEKQVGQIIVNRTADGKKTAISVFIEGR